MGWVSGDRSACSAVASGARISSSVFRGLPSVWLGLWTSTVIDAFTPGSKIHFIRAAWEACRATAGLIKITKRDALVVFPKQLRQAGMKVLQGAAALGSHTQWLIKSIYARTGRVNPSLALRTSILTLCFRAMNGLLASLTGGRENDLQLQR